MITVPDCQEFEVFRQNAEFVRVQIGLTQIQLAERTEIAQTAISQYLSGKKEPRISTMARIARGLGIPLRLLFDPDFRNLEIRA